MIDKMRQALAWGRAVPALWVGTVAVLTMGLGYGLALGVVHTLEQLVRRGKPSPAAGALRRVHPRPTRPAPS